MVGSLLWLVSDTHMRFWLFAFLLNVSLMLGQPNGIPQFHATVVVTDSSGARISGAEILIERYDERTTAQTDNNGLAHLRVLMGHYNVKVSANGLKTAEFSDFAVKNDEALLNVVLQPGKVVTDSPGDFPPEPAQTIPSNLPWNLADDSTVADEPQCKSNSKVVGACFAVRGRLGYWNGTPSTRIWVVGTHRVLGLPEEDTKLPNSVKAHLQTFGDEITADYVVCPFTKYRKGTMQMVCVQSASNVQYTHVKE
jgi:Carboxypeptidase regulatory-like domain